MIKPFAILVHARWRNISRNQSQPYPLDRNDLRKSDIPSTSTPLTFASGVSSKIKYGAFNRINCLTVKCSGRCCRSNPRRDGERRSSKCAQTLEGLHRGFRRSFWALDQVILKTPTLSYLVIFLDLKFTHYLPSSTVIQICNSRVKTSNT